MSIVTAVIAPNGQWARVAVDSEAVNREGQKWHVSKILALPHMTAILAGRGELAFLMAVFVNIALSGLALDDIAEAMPEMLGLADEATAEVWRRNGLPIESLHADGEPSVVLIGYSERQSRIIAKVWGGYASDPPRTGRDVAPAYYAPAMAPGDEHPLTPLELERVARLQVKTLRDEHGPGCAAGGDLVTATINAHGITFCRTAGALA